MSYPCSKSFGEVLPLTPKRKGGGGGTQGFSHAEGGGAQKVLG